MQRSGLVPEWNRLHAGCCPPPTSPRTIPTAEALLAPLLSAALLVLTLVVGFVAFGGRTERITLPAVPAPASWSNTLVLRAGLSTMPAGEVERPHRPLDVPGSAEAWQSTAPSLPELLYVEAGSLVATVDAKATLARATSVKRGAVSVPVGDDIPLRGGDLLVVPAGARFTLRAMARTRRRSSWWRSSVHQGERNQSPALLPESPPRRLGSGTLTGLPSESSIVILRRLDVGPRTAIPEETTAGPELLVVEAGSVRLRAARMARR